MSKGGGSQTTTTTQSIDPYIKQLVGANVDRAKGIADTPFQAYTGNPYEGLAGVGATPGTPATEGYWSQGGFQGYDEYGQPIYANGEWVPGQPATPGTPGQSPTFNPSQFVAPLSQNQNMAVNAAPGLLGAGQGAVNAGIQGAAGLLNYQPGQINPATAGTATAGAQGYNPALLGNAPQMQAAYTGAAQAGPAAQAQFTPAGITYASTAQINRGDVGNVGANSGLGGIAGYQNPYTSQVVNAALSDIDLQRQRSIVAGEDAAIGAGAFGGSRHGVADALTNEAYGRQAAQTAAQLRAAGFDTAAALSQQDASRAQQGQAANQAADLSVAGQNAGYQQQSGLTNANAANNLGQFNAQGLFGASQFNAGAQNQNNQFNAANQQQAGMFNAGNQQAASAANTGLLADFMRSNQASQNAADMFNAQNQTGISQFNAGALNQGNQYNASAINQAQAQNQQAGLAGAGINANAAGLLGTLGGQQQGLLSNGINALAATGGLQQQNQQAGLDAGYNEFLRRLNYDPTMQGLINQSLGLLPQGGTTTQTGPKPDQTAGLLGGLGTLMGGAGLLFSDGRLKEDLTFDGYDNENRRWYTYRYIWDEHGMRRSGVIAQEVMQTDPEAVSVHPSGFYMVDYSKLVRH